MLKKLVFLASLALISRAQVTYTAPVTAPKPAVLNVTSPSGSCVITGDAIPAANLIVNCTFGSIKDSRTVGPFTTGTALTFQYNAGGHALTIIVNAMTLPINVTGTLDGSTAVGGTF